MLIIQVVIVAFAVYALTRTFNRFRKRAITSIEWVVWSLFWLAVAIFVLNPGITQWIARILGVGRGADAMFYLGLVGLCYAFFRLYLRIRLQDQQLTVLVRRLAIQTQLAEERHRGDSESRATGEVPRGLLPGPNEVYGSAE